MSDSACGTGGFFLAAYDFLINTYNLDKGQKIFLKNQTFFGNEIVANVCRLALMNMFLHNIGGIAGKSTISPNDFLLADTGDRYDHVLTNLPFEKKAASRSPMARENRKRKIRGGGSERKSIWGRP